MKNYKYSIVLLVSVLFFSCNDDEKGDEYPGNIIIHGDITNMKLEETNGDSKARFEAFSGGNTNDLSLLDGENFTYELWIKVDPDAAIGKRSIPAQGGNPEITLISGEMSGGACISERINNFEMYLITDDDADYAIQYNSLNLDNQPDAKMQSNDSSINMDFGKWYHIAISRSSDDNTAKFYINGTLINSSTDDVWKQLPDNDKRLNFNCMDRNGSLINFFKGGMNNIRISTIDRYPSEFTPNYNLNYGQEVDEEGNGVFEEDDLGRKIAVVNIDDATLLQLNLNNILTDFSETSSNYNIYKKLKILGKYSYYIKIHNNYFSWEKNIEDEYPVTGY